MKNSIALYTELKRVVGGTVKFNEPLKYHTSFRIGGPADVFIIPRNEEDLRQIAILSSKYKEPLHIIGNGTKILALDRGVRGVVVKISNVLSEVRFIGENVLAGSGTFISRLSKLTAEKGLSGLEFAIGIPGTVGGAVVMNAGAHGQSVSDIITNVTIMNLKGENRVLSKEDLEFDYRKSILQENREIVLNCKFELRKEEPKKTRRKIEKFVRWRKKAQPLGLPNAGSVFKNPKNNYAGRLIEAAGFKGARIGDAQVSTRHANFIVNLGNAKAEDVLTLIQLIEQEVSKKFGIDLIPEVRILGE